jgi:hypothetical protein
MALPIGDRTIDANGFRGTITGFSEAFQGTGGVAQRVLYGWFATITVVG